MCKRMRWLYSSYLSVKDRNYFQSENVLASHVKGFITVFELKVQIGKEKRLKTSADYTVPRECPSFSSASDLSSSSQKPETLRGSN